MRRSGGKRSSLLQAVKRHKVSTRKNATKQSSSLAKRLQKLLQQTAIKVYNLCFDVCSTLCFIPVQISGTTFQGSSKRKRGVMIVFYITVLASMAYKLWACYDRAFNQDIVDINTFLGFMHFVGQFMSLCLGLGIVLQERQYVQVLNSQQNLWDILRRASKGKFKSPFDITVVSFQALASAAGPVYSSIGLTVLLNIYFDKVPGQTFLSFENADLTFSSEIFRWIWRVLLFALDFYQVVPILTVFATVGQLIVLHVGTLKLAVKQLREMSSRDLTERKKLEHLYNTVQVFLKSMQAVTKPLVVPMFFSIGATVVFLIYFPLKHPELPGMLTAVLIFGVSILMGVAMTASVDLVKTIRASEELIGELQSISGLPSDLLKTERMELLKTAKAYKPLNVPFGIFADFSLDVPIVMWEEVINQLLFLLSF